MYCYLIKPYRLRTPSVVQAQFDDKGRYVVGQTTVPEHNLQKTRAKKRKEESVQNMYNQILKQQVPLQTKYLFGTLAHCSSYIVF